MQTVEVLSEPHLASVLVSALASSTKRPGVVKKLKAVTLDMRNSTPEPDGSVRRYVLSVDGDAYNGRAGRECLAAMASTWRTPSDYSLYFETPEHYRPFAES